MHLGPLRTFYTHNTCISYVTPVCLYIAHRILFSYQAYRSLPEPSSKPESEKKAEGTVWKRMYRNLAFALPNTPNSHALTCVREPSPQVPVPTAWGHGSARIMEVFTGWVGLAWAGRKKLGPLRSFVHELPPSGNYCLELGPPAGSHQIIWFSVAADRINRGGSMVPKGRQSRKTAPTQGRSFCSHPPVRPHCSAAKTKIISL